MISWDYNFEPADFPGTFCVFTLESAALKEAIDDLEWPGSSIQIKLRPDPPSISFKGEGHGDLQIALMDYGNTDLLIAFNCDHEVSYRFLTCSRTSFSTRQLQIYPAVLLKITEEVDYWERWNVKSPALGYQQPGRIAFIEFFVKPEEDVDTADEHV
ncbi:uncharacterized protein LOC123196527 [Mangifera indica]|uniref:uncharacterized protein LOC123196527 n=1 Tax=Mangifera indica TaxID=29780 RepID=UPI001CFA1A5E|nr:uncharacterized protein LOC123196527 [Mangifera indica]